MTTEEELESFRSYDNEINNNKRDKKLRYFDGISRLQSKSKVKIMQKLVINLNQLNVTSIPIIIEDVTLKIN